MYAGRATVKYAKRATVKVAPTNAEIQTLFVGAVFAVALFAYIIYSKKIAYQIIVVECLILNHIRFFI